MLALRLGLAQCLAHVAGIPNGPAADFENDVPGLKAFVGWATWLHRGDDDTLFARARDFARWRDLQSKVRRATGWSGVLFFGACPLFVRHLRQGHGDAPGLTVSNNIEFDRSIRCHLPDGASEVASIFHLRAIDRSNHIAGFDPSFGGRATALRLSNHRACCFIQAEALGDLGSHWLDLHAEPPTRDVAVLLELRHDRLCSIRWNIEANADRTARR